MREYSPIIREYESASYRASLFGESSGGRRDPGFEEQQATDQDGRRKSPVYGWPHDVAVVLLAGIMIRRSRRV